MEDLGEVDPLVMILIACLSDEIASLAKLYRAGAWREDPREIGDWLKDSDRSCTMVLEREARAEFFLQDGGCTEGLIEALESETSILIDRGRILRIARERGEAAKGSKRGRYGVRPRSPVARRARAGKGGAR
jgi:hypothetical protein